MNLSDTRFPGSHNKHPLEGVVRITMNRSTSNLDLCAYGKNKQGAQFKFLRHKVQSSIKKIQLNSCCVKLTYENKAMSFPVVP